MRTLDDTHARILCRYIHTYICAWIFILRASVTLKQLWKIFERIMTFVAHRINKASYIIHHHNLSEAHRSFEEYLNFSSYLTGNTPTTVDAA
jgi:hypothetical protein